jgi:uncharacterized membrane protein
VITVEISESRLIARAFEKIRQSARGMPAVMIRQLDALSKITAYATTAAQQEALRAQAQMILRASEESVSEAADRADVKRAFDAFDRIHSETSK